MGHLNNSFMPKLYRDSLEGGVDIELLYGVNQQHRLWQRILASTSFRIARSFFAFMLSPNFRLIAENVDSTLLRAW